MTAVVALICTLVALGVAFVLPQWSGLWFHVPLTAWLTFSVLFNYHAAVTKDPGQQCHAKLMWRLSLMGCAPYRKMSGQGVANSWW